MAVDINGMRVAFVVANEGVEEVELTEPWKAIEQAGGRPELLAPERGDVRTFHSFDEADTYPVDGLVSEAAPSGLTRGSGTRSARPSAGRRPATRRRGR